MKTLLRTHSLLSLVAAALASASGSFGASEALHWNDIAIGATTHALPLDPVSESRILAIVHLAMHDAANLAAPRFATYGTATNEFRGAAVDAAIAAAAHASLAALLPAQAGEFEVELARRGFTDSDPIRRGLAAGRHAAAQLLALRRDDGADRATAYTAGTLPGQYRPTPPDFTPAFLTHWGQVRPFVLNTSDQFRPAAPAPAGSAEANRDLDEVRAIGGADSTTRTLEQSEIAQYWWEASTRGWNRIARSVATTRRLDVLEQARLLALVHAAMADGFIAGFEAKYHYNFWRPATAIREQGQPDWLSYLPTPPVPDYPSTHTVLGAAAATAMAACLGTDYVSFAMTSGEPYPDITRRFWSLSQAAQENGCSRVFGGLHFTSAVQAGYQQGSAIGDWVAHHALRPLDVAPVRLADGK